MLKNCFVLPISLIALGACAADVAPADFDPALGGDGVSDRIATAKADGAFGARDIGFGDELSGETSGDGVVLFVFQADASDEIRIEATRSSGDLRPAAYLYEGVETTVRPDDYDASSTQVTLNYTLDETAEYYIAVRAYQGQGAGEFTLALTCNGGPCSGVIRLTGLARADQCVTRAGECALRELPSYNGRVGAVTANRILTECLESEGSDCADACDADPHLATACETIVGELPLLADQSRGCLVGAAYCLGTCNEVSPFGYGEEDYLISATCWAGHQGDVSSATGHCVDYYWGLTDCGGSDYEGDTSDGCEALCASTDGAWDEGPWDGCYDECQN